MALTYTTYSTKVRINQPNNNADLRFVFAAGISTNLKLRFGKQDRLLERWMWDGKRERERDRERQREREVWKKIEHERDRRGGEGGAQAFMPNSTRTAFHSTISLPRIHTRMHTQKKKKKIQRNDKKINSKANWTVLSFPFFLSFFKILWSSLVIFRCRSAFPNRTSIKLT